VMSSDQQQIGKWIPLESNPEVMNKWASLLGLQTKVDAFSDVYGLDLELLSLVPQPSKALILCFPITEELIKAQTEDDTRIAKEGQHPLDPTLVYSKQTIGNACGTIALLHAIGNSEVTIEPLSPLAQFLEELQPLTPEERAAALEKTNKFAKAHSVAANQGQSTVPNVNAVVNLHFVAFVQASSAEDSGNAHRRIVELDGRRPGPIDHGPFTNFLEDVAKLVRKKFIAHSTSQNFGLVSLGPPPL